MKGMEKKKVGNRERGEGVGSTGIGKGRKNGRERGIVGER